MYLLGEPFGTVKEPAEAGFEEGVVNREGVVNLGSIEPFHLIE